MTLGPSASGARERSSPCSAKSQPLGKPEGRMERHSRVPAVGGVGQPRPDPVGVSPGMGGWQQGDGRHQPPARGCAAGRGGGETCPCAQLLLLLREAVERGRGCWLWKRADSALRGGDRPPARRGQRSRSMDLRPGPGTADGKGTASRPGIPPQHPAGLERGCLRMARQGLLPCPGTRRWHLHGIPPASRSPQPLSRSLCSCCRARRTPLFTSGSSAGTQTPTMSR